MSEGPWTDDENDLIVADYFAMLERELAGEPFNKAERNRALQPVLGRSKGSIEFKHQNISAVLRGLGETWIRGYTPAFNFQDALIDAVARWLARRPDWPAAAAGPMLRHMKDDGALWVGPAPTLSNQPPPDELERMTAIARRFDVAERDVRNRALGRAGEARALAHERAALRLVGRDDLARRVEWVSDSQGDGLGYDIASFEPDGAPRLLEVKTTNGWERTPFHISRNELAASEAERAHWVLLRLWNFAREPRAYALRPPLAAHVSLIATSYEARLN